MLPKKKINCGINFCGIMMSNSVANVRSDNASWISTAQRHGLLWSWMGPSIMIRKQWKTIVFVRHIWNLWGFRSCDSLMLIYPSGLMVFVK